MIRHCAVWADRRSLRQLNGGTLANYRSELLAEFHCIVGEHDRLVAGAGDGDVSEARIEQAWGNAGIGVK